LAGGLSLLGVVVAIGVIAAHNESSRDVPEEPLATTEPAPEPEDPVLKAQEQAVLE
jgi:hypothetical protein